MPKEILIPLQGDIDERRRFLDEVVDLVKDSFYESQDEQRTTKVLNYLSPEEIRAKLDTRIYDDGVGFSGIVESIPSILKYSLKTSHPRFLNMLYAGVEEAGIAGELITAVCNTSMATFEVAPVFSIIESDLLTHMRRLAGLPVENGDGVFCPGGSMSNFYAMLCARYVACPDSKENGIVGGEQLVAFTSRAAHYSTKRAAYVLGYGTKGCVAIDTDEYGRMIPSKLREAVEEAIKSGKKPFFVSATSCTTVEGAFDPLDEIADICKTHGLWFHIDAAYGGSALLSSVHRQLMKGSDRADSITWNPHKLLGIPLQCSALLLRQKALLQKVMSMGAKYIFHDHDDEDSTAGQYDTGDKSLQCGRKVDALKLWMSWKTYGDKGFAARIEKAFKKARYVENIINASGGKFVLRQPITSVNVCFWYVPSYARGLEEGHERDVILHETTKSSRLLMQREGLVMVNQVSEFPAFYRLVVNNTNVTDEDLDFALEKIAEYSEAVRPIVERALSTAQP